MRRKNKMNRQLTRKGKLLGCYAPNAVFEAIKVWTDGHPERNISTFIREAAREKLRRDGIQFDETVNSTAK